jgi:alpha-beta hydrolase superfamily lysophospholipase
MRAETTTIPRPDGAAIFVHRWFPDEGAAVRGVIQVVHGLAEHGGRYARFASAAVAAGFAVVATDHRGHGRTARTEEEVGHFADHDGWSVVVADLAAVAAQATAWHPGAPLLLLGHSMGSTLSMHLLATRAAPYRAVALTGPVGVVGPIRHAGALIARLERRRIGRRGKSWLLDKMSFGDFNRAFSPARTAFDWLSRDPAEVDAYVADPRCGFWVSTQHWVDHLAAIEQMISESWLRQVDGATPMWLLAGDMDPVSQGGRSLPPFVARLRAAGVRDVSLKLYAGARHEILNETNREEVTSDILGFFGRHAG